MVSLASTTSLAKYDIVQNNSLRIITGRDKSTLITAMQFQEDLVEILESHEDKSSLNSEDNYKDRQLHPLSGGYEEPLHMAEEVAEKPLQQKTHYQ